jgi:hypothetical protein
MSDLIPQSDHEDLFDRISGYYLSNVSLSPKDKEIAERWELAFALLLEHRNRKSAVAKLRAVWKQKTGKPLGQTQAYDDMKKAEKVFAPISMYSKDFLKLTIIESALRDIKQAERRARQAITQKDWNLAMMVKDKAEKRVMRVAGIDSDSADIPDFSKLQPGDLNIEMPAELMNMMSKILKSGVVDATEFVVPGEIEDINFEEADNE